MSPSKDPAPRPSDERAPDRRGYMLGEPRVAQLTVRARTFLPALADPSDGTLIHASPDLLGVSRAEIYLTSRCNLACRYCNSRHRSEPPWPSGRLEALVDTLAATGTRHIQWTGGEATVDPALPRLVARATALGMDSSISTNGTASPTTYDALVQSGMGRFYISLDLIEGGAFDRETGSQGMLQRVRDNIALLCALPDDQRPHVTVNSILDPNTTRTLMANGGHALRRLLGWCQDTGVDDFKFLPASRARLVTIFEDEGSWEDFENLCRHEVPANYSMFHYRMRTMRAGGHGLPAGRPHPCWLCLDDRAFDSQHAYPCIVRLREGATPLYRHTDDTAAKLAATIEFLAQDRTNDPICGAHCYDLYRELSQAVTTRLQVHGQPG